MDILSKIQKANYAATEHDVELLAQNHLAHVTAANHTDGSYLKILVASLKARRPDIEGPVISCIAASPARRVAASSHA